MEEKDRKMEERENGGEFYLTGFKYGRNKIEEGRNPREQLMVHLADQLSTTE